MTQTLFGLLEKGEKSRTDALGEPVNHRPEKVHRRKSYDRGQLRRHAQEMLKKSLVPGPYCCSLLQEKRANNLFLEGALIKWNELSHDFSTLPGFLRFLTKNSSPGS